MFYGIIIYLYFVDNKNHNSPHIHAKFQGYEAVVSIPVGDVLDGRLPKPKMKLLQAWIEVYRLPSGFRQVSVKLFSGVTNECRKIYCLQYT